LDPARCSDKPATEGLSYGTAPQPLYSLFNDVCMRSLSLPETRTLGTSTGVRLAPVNNHNPIIYYLYDKSRATRLITEKHSAGTIITPWIPLITFLTKLLHGTESFFRICQSFSCFRISQYIREPQRSLSCSQEPSAGP
jgi:hypothetical protein